VVTTVVATVVGSVTVGIKVGSVVGVGTVVIGVDSVVGSMTVGMRVGSVVGSVITGPNPSLYPFTHGVKTISQSATISTSTSSFFITLSHPDIQFWLILLYKKRLFGLGRIPREQIRMKLESVIKPDDDSTDPIYRFVCVKKGKEMSYCNFFQIGFFPEPEFCLSLLESAWLYPSTVRDRVIHQLRVQFHIGDFCRIFKFEYILY
jgi:hypothetical protein